MITAAELIALETAMRDLARLYEAALLFAPLQARAEDELLPRLSELGQALRHHVHADALGPAQIQAAAAELHSLTSSWQQAFERVRTGPVFTAAVDAFARNDQAALGQSLPHLFAGLRLVSPAPVELFFGVSTARPRRHAGARPFLTAEETAEKIAGYRAGIAPEPASDEWWDQALPALTLDDQLAALETPIVLALDLRDPPVTVFRTERDLMLRIYAPRLVVPFAVVLANDPNDEWWEAAGEPYPVFREALREQLVAKGIAVRISAT